MKVSDQNLPFKGLICSVFASTQEKAVLLSKNKTEITKENQDTGRTLSNT